MLFIAKEKHPFCYDRLVPEMSLVGRGSSLKAMQSMAKKVYILEGGQSLPPGG